LQRHGERAEDLESHSDNQRLFDRINVRFPARLSQKNAAESSDAIIKDFSPIGAKVLASQKISLFDRLSISFTPSQDSSVAMQGHVVWISKNDGGTCHIGIKFDDVDLLKAGEIMAVCR
jgi:hypothetical protein